jgi:hypothetical protein
MKGRVLDEGSEKERGRKEGREGGGRGNSQSAFWAVKCDHGFGAERETGT